MSSDDVLQRGTREITEVHQFFHEWFRGESTEEAFSRFDEALDSGFVIIGPGGGRSTATPSSRRCAASTGSVSDAVSWARSDGAPVQKKPSERQSARPVEGRAGMGKAPGYLEGGIPNNRHFPGRSASLGLARLGGPHADRVG